MKKWRIWKKKEKKTKKCPRCGTVCATAQNICEECGLIFSRLEIATNKEAKRRILHRDRDFIIYTKDLPKDVSRWRLILYVFLFGLVGGHYFYVGKFWKGALMCVMFIYTVLGTIFNSVIVAADMETLAYFPVGIYVLCWIMSIVFVISNRFKVPIMVEQPKVEDAEKLRNDFNKFGAELRAEIDSVSGGDSAENAENFATNVEKSDGTDENGGDLAENGEGTDENSDVKSENSSEKSENLEQNCERKTGKIAKKGVNKKGTKRK